MPEEKKITRHSTFADFLYLMGDVAAGKISFKEACKDLGERDKERAQRFFDVAKQSFEILKSSIKEQSKDNEMAAKYDLSAAVKVKTSDGKTTYMGVKPQKKRNFFQKLSENYGKDMILMGEFLVGKKTYRQVQKERFERVKANVMASSSLVRKIDAVVRGTGHARKRIKELQGLETPQLQKEIKPENLYDKLENEQFSVAMHTAYQNIVRMQHFGSSMSDAEKDKALAEIALLMESAQKRMPEIKMEAKGSYFTEPKLQDTEARLFSYMKGFEKIYPSSNEDMKKYANWRNGEDFSMPIGTTMQLTETPFHNFNRYLSPRADDGLVNYTANDHLFKPLEAGKNVMTAKEFAEQKALVSRLNIR